ncbi:MAG: GHMP kinase [Candidatus Pacearchaeota archaeon]
MIISRTPLRVSFVGGGTDLPSFCIKERGAVISTSIQKYVYIVVHPSFDRKNLIAYSKIEKTNNVDEITNARVKEAMKLTGITKGIEIHSIAEVPAGTGMGSSSSFTVGLLNALYAFQEKNVNAEKLAREAANLEINTLKEPIGKQDHYAVAFGGFNKIEFIGDEVKVKPLIFKKSVKKELEGNLLLFYLGGERTSSSILIEQNNNIKNDKKYFNILLNMRDLADEAENDLLNNDLNKFGELLHKNWILKKQLSNRVTNSEIDRYYDKALKAGAKGGKLLGAGGTGFLLIYAEPNKQNLVRKALEDLREIELKFDSDGSKIIYYNI